MLSQYEQHQLAAIERQLQFDDPVLALSMSKCSRLPRRHGSRRLVMPTLVVLLGLIAIVVGLVLANAVVLSLSLPLSAAGAVWFLQRRRGYAASAG